MSFAEVLWLIALLGRLKWHRPLTGRGFAFCWMLVRMSPMALMPLIRLASCN